MYSHEHAITLTFVYNLVTAFTIQQSKCVSFRRRSSQEPPAPLHQTYPLIATLERNKGANGGDRLLLQSGGGVPALYRNMSDSGEYKSLHMSYGGGGGGPWKSTGLIPIAGKIRTLSTSSEQSQCFSDVAAEPVMYYVLEDRLPQHNEEPTTPTSPTSPTATGAGATPSFPAPTPAAEQTE